MCIYQHFSVDSIYLQLLLILICIFFVFVYFQFYFILFFFFFFLFCFQSNLLQPAVLRPYSRRPSCAAWIVSVFQVFTLWLSSIAESGRESEGQQQKIPNRIIMLALSEFERCEYMGFSRAEKLPYIHICEYMYVMYMYICMFIPHIYRVSYTYSLRTVHCAVGYA